MAHSFCAYCGEPLPPGAYICPCTVRAAKDWGIGSPPVDQTGAIERPRVTDPVPRRPGEAWASGHPRFHELVDKLRETHIRKGADYSRPDDILSNLRASTQMGIPAWVGVVLRMSDKMERIKNLARKIQNGEEAAVRDESIVDTLEDLSNYSLLAVILFEESK